MLSYLHHFHAGNHGDLLKHWLLLECLEHMQRKDKGIDCIDTHAGAGVYHLHSPEARKTAEAESGILRFLANPLAERLLPRFFKFMSGYTNRALYPGSPECVRALLRAQDRSWLFELHPKSFGHLQAFEKPKQIFVRQEDGPAQLTRLLPSPTKRALVILDPSYEVKSEYLTTIDAMASAWRKMPGATYLIWYPLVEPNRSDQLKKAVRGSGVTNVLSVEMAVARPGSGMYGSGLVIVNPPWQLADEACRVLPELSRILSQDDYANGTCEQLVHE